MNLRMTADRKTIRPSLKWRVVVAVWILLPAGCALAYALSAAVR